MVFSMERSISILDKVVVFSLFVFTASSLFSISIAQVAAGLGGMAWLLRTYVTGSWREQRWPLGIPFALFALACLVAVINAYNVGYSYSSLKKLFEILIFFWVVNCVHENRLRDSLSALLIVAATLAGLFGLYQVWDAGVPGSGMYRTEGTMSVYTTFAGLLMIVGMIAVGRVLFKYPRENWIWLALVIIVTCLVFTLSRQAWFGFLIGFVYILGFFPRFWSQFLIWFAAPFVL